MIHELNLSSLDKLDYGKAAEAFQQHLRRAAMDCMDRPGDNKPRRVVLQFDFVPVLEADLDCTEVKMQVQAFSKLPTHRTKVYSMGLRKNCSLVFNEDSPESIDQTTIFDGEVADGD